MNNWLRPTALKRGLFFVGIDFLLSLLSFYISYLLRFNFHIPQEFLAHFFGAFFLLVSLKIGAMYIFRSYHIIWRFFSFLDASNLLKAHIVSYALFVIIYMLFPHYFYLPRTVIVIDFFLSLSFIGTFRSLKRLWSESFRPNSFKPTLLLGVNSKTVTIIQSALKGEIPYYPVAIMAIDENRGAKNSYINSIKVYDITNLEEVVKRESIGSVILTKPLPQKKLRDLVERLNNLGIFEIKQVKLLGSKDEKLEDLSIEDLLARHPKDLDQETIASFIKGKRVLITGGGGSIGSEIAKQCQKFGASKLILVDHSEYNLYQILEQLPKAIGKLLNITNRPLLEEIYATYRPEVVIHAAAYKHVPICEDNQESAVYNNVFGSKNVIDISIKYGVKKFVLISTDKAVRPTNVMGATKRVAELYAQNVDSKDTEIVAVRFGNVLGSSGSVIPKFKAQIEQGGPVTVTHPEITRYFMLIPEACQLVLQATAIANGGELFVLDMGEPIKIVDLAKQMIRLYNKEDEVEIVYTGLRPGEKLYEELLLDESEVETRYSSIFIAKPTHYDIEKLNKDIDILLKAEDKVEALQKIVPEFKRELV